MEGTRMTEKTVRQFIDRYGERKETLKVCFAPGKVNLLGDHTDYNGGYVLPVALEMGVYLAVRPNGTGRLRFSSGNFDHTLDVKAEGPWQPEPGSWTNYPLGLFDQLGKEGVQFSGLDLHYLSDLPDGAGLGSSAAIGVVTAVALNEILGLDRQPMDLAKLSQRAETVFAGTPCGIMDQAASALGKENHVLFLNCKTGQYLLVPVGFPGHVFLIAYTGKRREVGQTAYTERRRQCEQAVEALRPAGRWNFLSELAEADFRQVEHLIRDDTVAGRAFHVITENRRVLEAAKALHRADAEVFGLLMNASHTSLRDLYEVSCRELDVLQRLATGFKGVRGARMTGGGFGGCTLNLVEEAVVDLFREEISEAYLRETGLAASFYPVTPAAGARIVKDVE